MQAIEVKNYYTYDDLIASMDVEVLFQTSDDDYQGSTYLIVRDGERYGYMEFGWGSCSGCDALEAAHGYGNYGDNSDLRNVTELRDQIYNSTHWEDSAAKLFAFLADRDWKLQHSYWTDYEKFPSFIRQAVELLSVIAKDNLK